MPGIRRPPGPPTRRPGPPPSPAAQALGWGVYAAIALAGFCFGVWVGNQRSGPPTESAQATPQKEPPAEPPEKAPPKKSNPPDQPDKVAKKEPSTPTPPKKDEAKKPDAEPPPKKEPKTEEPKKEPVTPVLFAEKVQPLFRAKCTICHGDTKKPKADLDLRTLAGIAKGGESGVALVPGDLKKGSIWERVDDGSMPPPDKPPLTDAEKKTIRDWILSGGK